MLLVGAAYRSFRPARRLDYGGMDINNPGNDPNMIIPDVFALFIPGKHSLLAHGLSRPDSSPGQSGL